MFRRFFNNTVYVRVSENRFRIRHVETRKELEVAAVPPFSHVRLLIGNFRCAVDALKDGLRRLFKDSLFQPSPKVVIQPLERLEGGLSEVEERVFKELALSAGAREVVVWVGVELTDAEVAGKTAAK